VSNDIEAFIHYLQDIKKNDRGALASLRHSLAFDPGAYPKAFPYVERFVNKEAHENDPYRLALYAVAGLFARHPEHQEKRSLASAFGELMQRRSQSIENRFIALLSADAENVVDYLRQTISLLAAESMGFDYACLLHDLAIWMNPDSERRDSLRKHWARDFYRAAEPHRVSKEPESESPTSSA
jgi:CRISPR system Cascade subunit CasB